MRLREGLREAVALIPLQEPQLLEPTRSYDLVSNPNLRAYLEQCEEDIQGWSTWPVRSSRVPRIFERAIGFDPNVWVVLDILRNRGVIEFTAKAGEEKTFYYLDQDNLRAFFAFWWTLRQDIRLGKPLRLRSFVELERRVQKTQEALGSDPLRELLHNPLLNGLNKLNDKPEAARDIKEPAIIDSPSPSSNHEVEEDKGPITFEDVVIVLMEFRDGQRPSSKIPFIEPFNFFVARRWNKETMRTLPEKTPDLFEEVSFDKVPITPDEAKLVMFIDAARRGRLSSFDPFLEELHYRQLKYGVITCIEFLEKYRNISDLAELFWVVNRWLRQQEIRKNKATSRMAPLGIIK